MNQVSFLPVSYNDFTFKNIKYEYFFIYTIFQTRTLKNTFGEKKIVAYFLHGVQVPQAWSQFEE